MKSFGSPLLSLSAPLLVLTALLGILLREGTDRLQILPALFVGLGLIASGAIGRSRRRQKLLKALRKKT